MPITDAMGMMSPVAVVDGPGQGTPPATWLADEQGRERLLDMSPRVRALRNLTFVLQMGRASCRERVCNDV